VEGWAESIKLTIPPDPSTSELKALASKTIEHMGLVLQASYEAENKLNIAESKFNKARLMAMKRIIDEHKEVGTRIPGNSTLESQALSETLELKDKAVEAGAQKKFLQSVNYYLTDIRKTLEFYGRLLYIESVNSGFTRHQPD